jgi:UDP-N-acetylmuramate dehydrogenase
MPEAPLAPLTTWRIGGPAELLVHPADRKDLVLAVRWANGEGVPWRILGNGSNLLVADEGVRGLVLRIRKGLDELHHEEDRITSGAGIMSPALSSAAARLGLSGIEFLSGIPGTLGGAILMNAGCHGSEIGDYVEEVEYLGSDGAITHHDRRDCGFRYRGSRYRGGSGVLLGATLKLVPGDPVEIKRKRGEYAAIRRKSQPTALPSCGSVFQNPEGDFAGRLIDKAGLKGLRSGDIQISEKHANFFVNTGAGSSADVLALVEKAEAEVERLFGVRLRREFELWS